ASAAVPARTSRASSTWRRSLVRPRSRAMATLRAAPARLTEAMAEPHAARSQVVETHGNAAGFTRTTVAMDTLVTVQVEGAGPTEGPEQSVARALHWFTVVEQACSRFDPESELMRLCAQPGRAVHASALLFETLAF